MIREFFASFRWGELAREILTLIAIVIVINFVLPRSVVLGHSMEPNLHDGERLAGSPIPYWFGEPQRGDIVMLFPVEEDGPYLVKRLIGVPGDTIEFRDHQLYVNGEWIEESYVTEECRWKCRDQVWMLGEGEYFVMGDNRNTSYDSRNYGAITRDKIMAKVIFRWWPPAEIGLFSS